MKSTISTLAALLIFASGSVLAQESDYQILQDFRADYNDIVTQITNADSSEDISNIQEQIDQLEADYSGYQELLNSVLYPNTYEDRVSELNNQFSSTESYINTMEDLNERIAQLEGDMEEQRGQITQMDEDSEALRQRMERSSSNERRLSSLVAQYRENLENRDEFVSDFLENLLNRYEAMDSQTQSEIAEVSGDLEDDPLSILQTILSEYINQADRDSDLEAPDYIRMRAQHAYFAEVWDRIGERMANTYASESPVESRQEITDLLSAWETSVNNKLWNALSTSFNQNGIELPAFTSGEAFNNALNTFVDNAIETSAEQNEEADQQLYEGFSNYWNDTVKSQWGEYMINGEILTPQQIAAIDVKLGQWSQNAEPQSNLMFILFLISLAVILGLIVLLVTKKS